jgi:EmrB/QacA subfamily drug resistance transporter
MTEDAGTAPPAGTPSGPTGRLRVIDGPNAGRLIALGDETVLGRDNSADVVLADSIGELSRRHARIGRRGGEVTLEDLGSTNGTFLNGRRIQRPEALSAGDRIRVGERTLEFERPLSTAPFSGNGELQILSGPGAGTKARLLGGSATIGREPECDLQVLDPEVSRRHAKITVENGVAVIEDLHSANGTYVNGERIIGPTPLVHGDRFQIGEATIELTTPAFERTKRRAVPPQVSAVRDVVAHPAALLNAESGTRKWWTLAVASATSFMLLLDITVVAVALPSISTALHPSFSALQWVIDAYTLTLTAGLLTAGSMADIFGRKLVLSIGVVIFTFASIACAVSPNATALDFARGVQGIGGAIMFACALALIVQEFPAGERAIAFGVYGAVTGISAAVGPIVGGLLVQGIGWQAVFYLNVPIGIASFIVLQRKVVNLPGPPTTIDWGGLMTFSTAMFLAVFATIRGNDNGWTSTLILGCYGGAVALIAAFIAIELRREQPMFEITLFRNPTFTGSSLVAIAMGFSLISLVFYITTWLQSILGYSPIGTGLRFLTLFGPVLLIAPLAGRMSETVDPRITLTLGMVMIAGGDVWMTVVGTSSAWTAILPGLLLGGLGMGIINPTIDSTAVGVLPSYQGGMASGMNATCREFGTTAGIAVLGTLLQHQVSVQVHAALAGTSEAASATSVANTISIGNTQQLLASTTSTSTRVLLDRTAHLSYGAGLREIFYTAFAVAVAGAVAALILVRRRHLAHDSAAV